MTLVHPQPPSTWMTAEKRRFLQSFALVLAVVGLAGRNVQIISEARQAQSSVTEVWNSKAVKATATDTDGCLPHHHHHHHHHPSSAMLSNQTYAWYGNQWIPPPHVPLYSKEDMLEAFSHFDVLWIGDSTVRRAYTTLYALLNSTSSSSNVAVDELNHPSVIDINRYAHKGTIQEDSCQAQLQAAKDNYWKPGLVHMWTTSTSLCRKLPSRTTTTTTSATTATTATTTPSARSFDYARADCYRDVWRFSQLTWDIQRYSLIIVGVGLHELVRAAACAVPLPRQKTGILQLPQPPPTFGGDGSKNYTPAEQRLIEQAWRRQQGRPRGDRTGDMTAPDKLKKYGWGGAQQMADLLYQTHHERGQASGVLWRTSGFSNAAGNDTLQELHDLNRQSVEWITSSSSSSNNDGGKITNDGTRHNSSTGSNGRVTLVDWGAAIWPRSIPPHRIEGDIPAHYGLEARLLFAQMATQQVYRLLNAWKRDTDK